MDLGAAVRAEKLTGKDECVICSKGLPVGDRALSGEYRVGGKWIGKTVIVKVCIGCAQDLKEVLEARIREARAL